MVPPDASASDLTEIELSAPRWLASIRVGFWILKQQATRPQTLGYGLVDSPSGQAA